MLPVFVPNTDLILYAALSPFVCLFDGSSVVPIIAGSGLKNHGFSIVVQLWSDTWLI